MNNVLPIELLLNLNSFAGILVTFDRIMSEFPGSIPESSIPVRPTGPSHLSGDYHTSRPWHYTGEPILTALEFEPAISADNDDMVGRFQHTL